MNHTDFVNARMDLMDGAIDRENIGKPLTEAQQPFFSPKEVAEALGVSESSIKRWCDSGKIPNSKTSGGHRRMTTTDLIEYLRKKKRPIEFPELVGLPSIQLPNDLPSTQRLMMEMAVSERISACRDIILKLYLDHWSLPKILDEVVIPASDLYRRNGIDHQQFKESSYDHHCIARETCEEALRQAWQILPRPELNNLTVVGMNLGDRPDSVWSLGTQMVLWEMGCRFTGQPLDRSIDSLLRISLANNPSIVWACLPVIPHEENELVKVRDVLNRIARSLSAGVPILIAGTSLPSGFVDGLESVSVSYSLSKLSGAISKQFVL